MDSLNNDPDQSIRLLESVFATDFSFYCRKAEIILKKLINQKNHTKIIVDQSEILNEINLKSNAFGNISFLGSHITSAKVLFTVKPCKLPQD